MWSVVMNSVLHFYFLNLDIWFEVMGVRKEKNKKIWFVKSYIIDDNFILWYKIKLPFYPLLIDKKYFVNRYTSNQYARFTYALKFVF